MISIQSSELARVLRNGVLFAHSEKIPRPPIEQIRVEAEKDGLYLQSTDSYALIRERVPCFVGTDDVGKVGFIPTPDIRPMLAILKADKGPALIDIANSLVYNTILTIKVALTGATFECHDTGAFPNTDQLVNGLAFGRIKESATLGLGLCQLARLGKVETAQWKTNDHSVAARFEIIDQTRPVRVSIGPDIVVYVMPARLT
jgi:hypothetical protein